MTGSGEKESAGTPYTGPELPLGEYPILKDADDNNRYEQYFIVRPAGEWEFIEIGRSRKDSLLVQVTRQVGIYTLSADTLGMTATHGGNLGNPAGITTGALAAFPFQRKYAPSGYFPVRDIKADRFSAKDLFIGVSGWKTYIRGKLPILLPAPALGMLPRVLEPMLFTAPDSIRVFAGDTFKLDLAGPSPNPKTAMYYLKMNVFADADSSVTGIFPLTWSDETTGYIGVYARDAAGNLTALKEISVYVTRVAPAIRPFGTYTVHVEDSLDFPTSVTDVQNDIAEISIDYDGDGKADQTGKSLPFPKYVYHLPGVYQVTITARDSAGHVFTAGGTMDARNDAPTIDSAFTRDIDRPEVYRPEPWKAWVWASDREKNLIDSVWWDFNGDGRADTVSGLRDTLVKIFDSTGRWTASFAVKDRAGASDTETFILSVQPYKLLKRRVPFGAEMSQKIIPFQGRLWVLGGESYHSYAPDLWSSADGMEWTQDLPSFPMGDRAYCAMAEFKGKLWLFGGDANYVAMAGDAWNTADGTTWTKAGSNGVQGARYIVYRDKLWTFTRRYDVNDPFFDIWNSDDGVVWNKVSASKLAWPINGMPELAVFQDQLYLLMPYLVGGDVMERFHTSTDGVTWTAKSFLPPWNARRPSDLFPFKGKLWLFGGDAAIWNSEDGVTWKQHGRGELIKSNNRATVFGNKIYWITDRDVFMTDDP